MDLNVFHSLEVGDILYHPKIGTHDIESVEKRYDYDCAKADVFPYFPEITHSVTISKGRRLKEGDVNDLPHVKLMQRASDLYDHPDNYDMHDMPTDDDNEQRIMYVNLSVPLSLEDRVLISKHEGYITDLVAMDKDDFANFFMANIELLIANIRNGAID